jgi:hypothetical protein
MTLASLVSLVALSAVAAPPQKILFIGNSLTYSQNGIYYHLGKLAASANPPFAIETEKSVQGGATLKTLWEESRPRDLIRNGSYDVVVLQEDIPEIDVAGFREYASKFVGEIRKAKSRPVLFMAWSYRRLGWISMREIAQAHRDAANELNVDVAPVGLAWERSMRERPDLDLFVADREHPSIYGTYLATNVVYATVFEQNPSALRYVPDGISIDAAAFLRRVAWDTYQEWKGKR